MGIASVEKVCFCLYSTSACSRVVVVASVEVFFFLHTRRVNTHTSACTRVVVVVPVLKFFFFLAFFVLALLPPPLRCMFVCVCVCVCV